MTIPPNYSKNVTIADFMKLKFRNSAWTTETQINSLLYDVDFSELMPVVEELSMAGAIVTIKSYREHSECRIFDPVSGVQVDQASPKMITAVYQAVSEFLNLIQKTEELKTRYYGKD